MIYPPVFFLSTEVIAWPAENFGFFWELWLADVCRLEDTKR